VAGRRIRPYPASVRDPDDEVEIPALLRAARGVYGAVVRAHLGPDFEDLPRNGPYVLGGMVNHGVDADQLVRELGVARTTAAQLLDTLVLRGYLKRRPDEADPRRTVVDPTERGRAAAAAVRAGVRTVDDRLEQRLGADGVAALRAGLAALCAVGDELEAEAG